MPKFTHAQDAALTDLMAEISRRAALVLEATPDSHREHVVLQAVQEYLDRCTCLEGLVIEDGKPVECKLCFEIRFLLGKYDEARGVASGGAEPTA